MLKLSKKFLLAGSVFAAGFLFAFVNLAQGSRGDNPPTDWAPIILSLTATPNPSDNTVSIEMFYTGGAHVSKCFAGGAVIDNLYTFVAGPSISGTFNNGPFYEQISSGSLGQCTPLFSLGTENRYRAWKTYDTSGLADGSYTITLKFAATAAAQTKI